MEFTEVCEKIIEAVNPEDQFPYVEGQPAEMFYEGKWVRGKIIADYRFRDGIVTIITDDGKKIWCGEGRKELYRPVI